MITPDTALAVCRFLHDLPLMGLWGVSAFLAFLTPAALGGRIWQGFGAAPAAAVLLALATAVLALPLEAAGIAGDWPDALDTRILRDVLFSTTVGQAWFAQIAATLVLCLAFAVPQRKRCSAIALGAGLGLAALVFAGHASMAEGWRQILQRANDVTHLLAAGGWLGGLVGLVPLLRLAQQPQWQADAQVALRRFSTVGHVVVAVVVVSGAVNTALIVGQVPTDWTSPYQALLAAKIGLVALMLVLAVVNRYVLVPAMTGNRSTALAAMRRSCLAEIALAVVVVALVAVFGTLEPA